MTINTSKNIYKFKCEYCDFKCIKKGDYNRHILTPKHKLMTNNDKNTSKNIILFECECGKSYKHRQNLHTHKKKCSVIQGEKEEKCDYKCNKQSEFSKHISTRKHNFLQNPILKETDTSKSYICKCGKVYKHSSTLYAHKKKCSIIQGEKEEKTTTEIPTLNNYVDKEFMVKMFKEMFTQNKDVINKMMEIIPLIGPNNSNNNNTISNTTNNQFNIQMFLNEHCKNAMNLTDFIDTLPITAETYDNTIQNGLTKSMTNMLVNGLSQLDILKRPIHCTDASRKTLYVKDEDTWEKDTELQRLLLGITALAQKQRANIDIWQEVNEGWKTNENIQTKFTELIFHTMDDVENNEKETGKIIRAISKNVYLDNEVKNQYIN